MVIFDKCHDVQLTSLYTQHNKIKETKAYIENDFKFNKNGKNSSYNALLCLQK